MSRLDTKWQLLKVETRLACPDGGGAWRDDLLRQRETLRTLSQGGKKCA